MLASQIAWYSGVSGGCCPRAGGLAGSYWPPAPVRTHWPFQSGNLELSCDQAAGPGHSTANNAISANETRFDIAAFPLVLMLVPWNEIYRSPVGAEGSCVSKPRISPLHASSVVRIAALA